ncbi:hypothetical protein B296_00036348 [Ensete ventricosum]|uniref:Uncharacterized protein n=1 Tax=Ensete ventricosum TaxID=4639 RepID=A0A426XCC0_ENSVE|nr:hypothetical protein B296_00036348 [Ensete ventricosum]
MSVVAVSSTSALGDFEIADALAVMRFPTEWTFWTVSSSVLALSTDETKLVEILRGILSISRGVKDMNEAWLAEAGLSTNPGGMSFYFYIGFGLFPNHTFCCAEMFNLGKMKSDGEAGSGSAAPSVAKALLYSKECWGGEDPLVSRWSTISTSNLLWTEGSLSGEYLQGALHPTLAKQVYECSSEELMNRAGKSAIWASVDQELAAAAERQVKEMEAEIERMRTELESLRSQRREFKQEASQGFESGLEKMERVSYEFGYRVVLERLRGKHPDVMIELDPFAKCPEDAKIKMDLDQPFDDGTPSE